MSVDRPSLPYRIIKRIVKAVYPVFNCEGSENLPEEACVIVCNHCQTHGPLSWELYAPRKRYTWCISSMMTLKEVPAYAFKDFWSQKPKWTHPLYHLASYLIAPLAVLLFNNANTIPVYRDTRLLTTFRTTVQRLNEGADVVIFPEKDEKYNDIIYQFQSGFVETALMYGRGSGKKLAFVPAYLCPELCKIYLGKPTRFDIDAPVKPELERVKQYLMDEITSLARALPRHRVVPYRNIPKKNYPYNK